VALVTVLGGVAALVGSLLPWIQVGGGGRRRFGQGGLGVNGTSLLPGKVAMAAGIVLIVAGGAMWFVRSGEARRWLSVLAVVAGAVALGAVIAAFQGEGLGLAGRVLERLPGGGQGRGLGRLRNFGGLSPSHGPGLYLALTGGIAAVAGAVTSVFWTTVPVSAPPPAASTAAPAGSAETFSKGHAA
jgi:hypothetical protein